MAPYIARRLVEVVIALLLITTLVFILIHLTFGGVCLSIPANYENAPVHASCVDYYQLDKPLVDQYLAFIGNYLHGNLGVSLDPGSEPVTSILAEHLPATVLLLTVAFLLQQAIALPLGILAAARRYSLFDGVFSVLSYIFLSMPAFILGFALIWFVGVDMGLLPTGRDSNVTLPILGTAAWFSALWRQPALVLGDALRHLILPATTLAVVGIAIDSRFMRAAMLQELDQEYIRTARAKGVRWPVILVKHAFRNALAPIISNIAVYFPALIGSAMVVEYVFTYTGIGYTFTTAIKSGNTPVEQSIFLLLTAVVLLANLLADVGYKLADPRVEYR